MDNNDNLPVVLPHHVPGEFCRSRAPYRQGRKLTAVKVYTVSKESSHLLIFNVPAINLSTELHLLCERYGKLSVFEKLPKGLELEDFTDVFHVNYMKIPSARYAKKHLDSRSFYGGFLHVCYAPERETVEETRLKLITRRNEIAVRTGRKAKTKNTIPQRFNPIKRKQFDNVDLSYPECSGLSSPNEFSNVYRCQTLAQPTPTLIPTSIIKKRISGVVKPPQKKIARIVFHKTNSEN